VDYNIEKKQLNLVSLSYDRAILSGKKGINFYDNLPEYIKNDPDYRAFVKLMNEGSSSARPEIKKYLNPKKNMKFIDLGCCLNLMFNGYDGWPSTYYGIDISVETIKLLKEFSQKKNLSIGLLHCGSIHKTPFDNNCFDIGACVGVLEYFDKDYALKSIKEINRILKPEAKIIIEIPNIISPICKIMVMVEEYLGRPEQFNMLPSEFENMLKEYFIIEKKEEVDPMIQYFLICKK